MNIIKTVFVINISLDRKGSLNTFLQAMDAIKKRNNNDFKYHVFCRIEDLIQYQSKNINIELLTLSKTERILFERKFLINWSKKNKIYADLIISLQNTSINYFKGIPQIILFQQSIPLVDFKWNILKKQERRMWFYKNMYPFFVKKYLTKQTTIIAPTKWVRSKIIEKWELPESQVKVVYSQIRMVNQEIISHTPLDSAKNHLFYPSNSSPHKNHIILILALIELKKHNKNIFDNIILHLSINIIDSKKIKVLIEKNNLQDNILFEGEMEYSKVLSFYKSCDILVWPSFIESFGLPLLEAASMGIQIIASDLQYAKEVLTDYRGVKYVSYNNPTEWAIAIKDALTVKARFPNHITKFDSDWTDFIKIIEEKATSNF
jgi:glycosyltransferase involved in cell wall biosynthesis